MKNSTFVESDAKIWELESKDETLTEGQKAERLKLFRTDYDYLCRTVCKYLRKFDKYNRGLVLASNFNSVIFELGLHFGSPEVDLLMRFCTVTDDGYLSYKPLMLSAKESHIARGNNHVEGAIFPSDNSSNKVLFSDAVIGGKNAYNGITPELSNNIRILYTKWDRCSIKDEEFVDALRRLNMKITPEFQRAMVLHGPSRTLNFSKLLSALCSEDFSSHRKSRHPHPDISSFPMLSVEDRTPFYDPVRDPISWDKGKKSSNNNYYIDLDCEDKSSVIKELICDYLECKISGYRFRILLDDCGVPINPEIDCLIRSHEADNSGSFARFMKVIMRAFNSPQFAS